VNDEGKSWGDAFHSGNRINTSNPLIGIVWWITRVNDLSYYAEYAVASRAPFPIATTANHFILEDEPPVFVAYFPTFIS